MTTFPAALGAVAWLAGAVLVAIEAPGQIRRYPAVHAAVRQHPVQGAAWITLTVLAWPVLPMLARITERRKS